MKYGKESDGIDGPLVALVQAMIGAVLIYARQTGDVNPPVIFLAIGAAASLVLVEVVHVIKQVISPIYLGDAVVELILTAWRVVYLLVA